MNAFHPTGPLLSFTGANTAPTSVIAIANNATIYQDMCLVNTDSANDCIIGWGASDADAKLAADVTKKSNNSYYLQHSTTQIVRIPTGSYITGITPGSTVTAVIYVQAGDGN